MKRDPRLQHTCSLHREQNSDYRVPVPGANYYRYGFVAICPRCRIRINKVFKTRALRDQSAAQMPVMPILPR